MLGLSDARLVRLTKQTIDGTTEVSSRTVKLWVEILVKPVMLMMTYVMAEREGDWLLHLATFKKMLPYYGYGYGMACTTCVPWRNFPLT